MQYGDFKKEVMKLMFDYSNKGNVQMFNANNKDSLISMAEGLNYANYDMAKTLPIIKQYTFVQSPLPLCAGSSHKTIVHTNYDITVEFPTALAVSFEINGNAQVELYDMEGNLTEVIFNTEATAPTPPTQKEGGEAPREEVVHVASSSPWEKTGYIKYKRLCNGIKLIFKGEFMYNVKNMAGYTVTFPTREEIPDYAEYNKYDLKELTKEDGRITFLRLNERPLIYKNGGYDNNAVFYLEQNSIVVVESAKIGEFTLQYDYLPKPLKESTEDSFELEFSDDINAIMAYYVASRLIMDYDVGIGVMYNNIYEGKKREFLNIPSSTQKEAFVSVTGF